MYKYILENAGNINWMAIFSLLTFFTLFTITAFTVFKKSDAYIKKMSDLPLDDNQNIA